MNGAPSDDTHRAPQDDVPIAAPPRRVASRLWRGVAVVAVALVAVFASHPWWLARVWASRLAADSGREVRIERMALGLDAGGGVRITLSGVFVANAPWAQSPKPMADVREAAFVMPWGSLFAERKDIARLVLSDGSVDLLRLADGRRNWRLRNPDDTGPGRYRILALEPHRISLAFEHRGVDLAIAATARDGVAGASDVGRDGAGVGVPAGTGASAAAPDRRASGSAPDRAADRPPAAAADRDAERPPAAAPAGPLAMHVAIDGRWRGVPMAWALDTGPLLTFVDTGMPFPLRGTAEIGGVAVRIDGTAGDLFRDPLVDADVEVSGRSLAALAPFVGERWPSARAFRMHGRVTSRDGRIAIAGATATVGKTDLAGDLALVRSRDAPSATATLTSRRADWDDLAWAIGRTAPAADRAVRQAEADVRGSTRRGAPPPSSASATAASAAPTAASASAPEPARDRLARWTASLRYDAAVFHADAAPQLQRLAFEAELARGALAVRKVDVGIAGGRLQGSATAELAAEVASGTVELRASGFRLERLLAGRAGDGPKATGALSGRATLAARGATREALLDSLRGQVALDLSQGSISGLLDAQLGLSPGRIVRRMVAGDAAIALRCGRAAIELQQGVARIASLVVASERTRTTGRGRIDLGARTLDLTLTPESVGEGGWFDLDRSIRLSGPLAKPERKLVERVPIAASGC